MLALVNIENNFFWGLFIISFTVVELVVNRSQIGSVICGFVLVALFQRNSLKEHPLIKVLIVDDHALVRMGVRRLLEDLPDMQVVAEADSGESALSLVKLHQPDVVLLDMKMPGIDGWEVTRRLKKSNPHVKVIAVTAMSSEPLPGRVLQLGAMGYLTKETSVDEMAMAIRKVYRGERYLSAEVAQKMAIGSLQASQESPFDALSEREMQVMMMITSGMNVQEIAERLFLSSKTINGYRYRMFEKLLIKNDVELTYLAMKHGVIEHPSDAVLMQEE